MIYFVLAGDMVKIGLARTDPARRVQVMQTGCPLKLELIGTIDGVGVGHMAEAEWHRRFAHLRVRGEWFRWEPELEAAARAEMTPYVPRIPGLRRYRVNGKWAKPPVAEAA